MLLKIFLIAASYLAFSGGLARAENYNISYSPERDWCNFKIRDAIVKDERGHEIIQLGKIWINDEHGATISKDNVVWSPMISEAGEKSCGPVHSELWTANLKTKEKKMIAGKGIDTFLESPDGRFVAYVMLNDLKIFNFKDWTSKVIATAGTKERSYSDGFVLEKWSKDGSALWVGNGIAEGWGELGQYKNGKFEWFKLSMWPETNINPETGWLTRSTEPDPANTEEYVAKIKKIGNELFLCDPVSGKQISLSKAAAGHYYDPKWDGNNLSFKNKDDKTQTLEEKEIRARIQKSKSKCKR